MLKQREAEQILKKADIPAPVRRVIHELMDTVIELKQENVALATMMDTLTDTVKHLVEINGKLDQVVRSSTDTGMRMAIAQMRAPFVKSEVANDD